MGSIIPRQNSKGKTTYQVKVRVKGYPTKTATFDRITDARRWEQKTEVAIKEGRYFDTEKKVTILFQDVVDRYINETLIHKKPSTYKDQLQQLKYWRNKFGKHNLTDITSSLVTEHKNNLAQGVTPRGIRSKATVNIYR